MSASVWSQVKFSGQRLAEIAKIQFTGTTLTDEHKQKIGKAHKGHTRHFGQGNPTFDSKVYKFFNYKTLESFEGTRFEFLQSHDVNKGNLSSVISGKSKHTKGWTLT